MAGENERDRAARKAEKELARRAKRAKAVRLPSSGGKSATGAAALTPAAASLWQKTRQTTPARAMGAFASSLRSSYTPKVRSKSSASVAPGSPSRSRRPIDNAFNATPLASRSQKSK